MGLGFRIAPGVRISASSRGIRAGIGPRAARVHVGTGRTGFSTGIGPVTYYTSVGGSRRRAAGPSRSSIVAHERELRRVAREQEREAVVRAEESLTRTHLEEFPPTERQVAQPAEPVDRAATLKEVRKRELQGVSFFHRSARRDAKARAESLADEAVAAEQARRAQEQAAAQTTLDQTWSALVANDPDVVLQVLEAAFADNEMPAAAVDVDRAALTLLMMAPDPALIPERKPAITPTGAPTLKKRTKTEFNELYERALAAHLLATVKEAFAVAPGVEQARVLVLRREPSAGLAADRVIALFAGTFPRDLLAGVDWRAVDLARVLDEVPDALVHRRGRTGELTALDLTDEPDLASVVDQVHLALG
jgi:hypothetical protein